MKFNRTLYACFLLSTLMLGALACGGGGGEGGESFTVNGLWSVNGTSSPGTPNPDSGVCRAAADIIGNLPPQTLNVARGDGTVTATRVSDGGAFTGTANDSNQSFTLNLTTPFCVTSGACTICASAGFDFLNAAGDSADVNIASAATGNSACPVQCTIAFQTTATRS